MNIRTAAAYEIAEAMGREASNEDGEKMRAALLDAGYTSTSDVPEAEWLRIMDVACAPAYRADYVDACGAMHTPPECQGQIVEVSYGCSPTYIYERSYDRSDRTVRITAYEHPDTDDADFDPWNGTPDTGDMVGVVYEGRASDEPGQA